MRRKKAGRRPRAKTCHRTTIEMLSFAMVLTPDDIGDCVVMTAWTVLALRGKVGGWGM